MVVTSEVTGTMSTKSVRNVEYPSETDNAFVKECLKQKDLNKPTCECILKSVKRDYTVHSLIKLAFENQRQLETDLNLKTAQCLSK